MSTTNNGIALSKNSDGNYDVSAEDLLLFHQAIRDEKFAANFLNISGSGVFFKFTEEKFNTCQFRSEEKEFRKLSTCCDSVISGFHCNKKNIFNILEQDCAQCLLYQPKG